MLPDLLYLVGHESAWGDTEELRLSLRSVCQHLPHRNVMVVGHRPVWLQEVKHLPVGDRFEHPVRNTLAKLEAAVRSDLLGDRFVLMNDDFLVLRPVQELQHHTTGLMCHTIAAGIPGTAAYHTPFQTTYDALINAGIHDPFNYETHHPLPMCKAGVRAMLSKFGGGGHLYAWRSAYANWQPSELNTTICMDVKVRGSFSIPGPSQGYLSLSNDTHQDGLFRAWARARFSVPSPYESDANATW